MPSTKLMILGASQYQVPLIEAARQMGLQSYVASIEGDYPGIEMADVFLPVDITDENAVLEAARQHDVEGVVSASTDLSICSLGTVVDGLGLRGISYSTALKCTNKVDMKKAFHQYGVPTADFRIVSDCQQAQQAAEEIGYPLMVKAVDAMGSKGITKVCQPTELKSAWQLAKEETRVGDVLVEEFLDGLEFGAQAMIADNKLRYVIAHNDQVSPPPYCSPIGHSFPMNLEEDAFCSQLETCVQLGLMALGITHSHANVDCMLTNSGIKIIEIGARVGATCLPESTSIWTGMDVYRQIIDLALGRKPNCEIRTRQPNAALYIMAPKTGRLLEYVIAESVRRDADVYRLTMYAKPGDEIREFTTSRDRIGEVIVRGESAQQAEAKASSVAEKIIVKVI